MRLFDKYDVIRRLAVGGMGEIFLARQTGVAGFDRLAIIKTLLPELAEDQEFVQQFLDEARVASTLNHPNVVAVFEAGSFQGTYFMVMEYIEGENLSKLLKAVSQEGAHLPPAVAARIIHDAALGLDHAHAAKDIEGRSLNIIHRDVSPQNIMARTDGVTKVVDFGIAKAANRLTRTRTGILKGKLGYMAPEQISTRNVDALTDQYSLGVVLWELCATERMFAENDEVVLLGRIANERAPLLSTRVDGLPAGLSEIVERMTSPQAPERFRTCADVALALRDIAAPHEGVAEIIRRTVGEAIEQRVSDLTPSQEDFLVALHTPRSDPEAATVGGKSGSATAESAGAEAAVPGATLVPSRRRWSLVLGLAMVAAAAGVMGWLQPWRAVPAVEAPKEAPPVVQAARLVVTSVPSGAAVSLDGRTLGAAPTTDEAVAVGVSHRLRVTLGGYQPHERELTLTAGETREVDVVLTGVPTAKAKRKKRAGRKTKSTKQDPVVATARVERGFVSIDTQPWTHVSIDGEAVDITPISKHRLDVGAHSIRLVNEEAGIDETQTVVIEAAKVRKVRLKKPPR